MSRPPKTVDEADTRSRLAKGSRAAFIGLAINPILAAIKILAGIAGHSFALIADGVESCLDIFGSLVVVSGLRLASAPPDRDHPYGHGKAEPLAAFIVALLLLAAAVALATGSIREILHPKQPPAAYTLFVLLGVIVTKEILFRFMRRVASEVASNAVTADAWHHRSDAITSVAAFIGISIALVGGEGYEQADSYAALLACGIIAYNGTRLLFPALSDLMDAAPSPEREASIRAVAARVPGVIGLDKCHIRKMGLEYYVDLHIRVHGTATVTEGHRIAHAVKDSLRSEFQEVADVLVHVEPEADETGRSTGLA